MQLDGNKAERAVRQRAYELAESGRFDAARGVERALIGEGWPNAAKVMRSSFVHQAVEERCRSARNKAH